MEQHKKMLKRVSTITRRGELYSTLFVTNNMRDSGLPFGRYFVHGPTPTRARPGLCRGLKILHAVTSYYITCTVKFTTVLYCIVQHTTSEDIRLYGRSGRSYKTHVYKKMNGRFGESRVLTAAAKICTAQIKSLYLYCL
jgi:hypothetical protein